MTTPVCGVTYTRPNGNDLICTFVRGHIQSDHSWLAIRCADIADAEKIDYTPQAVQAFLDSMTRGDMDAYLEAILAVAHNRKRAIRGTPGFRSPR